MTKEELFTVVMETQSISDAERQRICDLIERLAERIPALVTNKRIAQTCAIYGFALARVPQSAPRKRKQNKVDCVLTSNQI